jgi:hypothetical protein
MFRRIVAIAAVVCGAALVAGVLPANASTGDGRSPGTDGRSFGIPGVYGIGAWGNYARLGPTVRITVCVTVNARGVYGGAAAGIAYDGPHRQAVTAVVVGFGHTGCRTMLTRYTNHLVVDAVSGWRNGKVRQAGRVRQIY